MNRLASLRAVFKKKRLDALLVSYQPNISYLCTFEGSFGYLLITPDDVFLATSFIYIEQARAQASHCRLVEVKKGMGSWLPSLLKKTGIKKLGFEKEHLSYQSHLALDKAATAKGVKLTPLSNVVESLRQQKEARELALIKEAVDIADAALAHLLVANLIGMTEIEVAWEIESFIRKRGSQQLPFPVIVASGPNSALPHAQPTQRVVRGGEPLLFDFGARINGYASDLSRTICPGENNETFGKVYAVVLKAQLTVIEKTRGGMSGAEIDEIARQVIRDAGYGKNYGHGLGHGLGLEVHEPPYLSQRSKDTIRDSMVFTVEPGIYLPGWGGVRIEDTVTMDCGRIKMLSQADK